MYKTHIIHQSKFILTEKLELVSESQSLTHCKIIQRSKLFKKNVSFVFFEYML